MKSLSGQRLLKIKSKIYCFLLVIISSTFIYGQSPLSIKWTLTSTNHKEIQATARQNLAISPPKQKGDKLFRYFQENNLNLIDEVSNRHNTLWELYKKSLPSGQKADEKGYIQYARDHDPYFLGLTEKLAPVLNFDFLGNSGKEYVLDNITVKTISFDEYAGGGFSNGEAWYEIKLPKQGSQTYKVQNKLRFTSSGTAKLKFLSDNYYPSMGLSPIGCYMIDITFNFIVDNKTVSVSTGSFKIDV